MNNLSPQTIQMLLARRDPGTIQAMVQRGIISPQMAQQAMQTPPQGAGAMAPPAVAGDAVLGGQPQAMTPIGASLPPLAPPKQRVPAYGMTPASSASPAPAVLDGMPVSTVGDLNLGSSLAGPQAGAGGAPPPAGSSFLDIGKRLVGWPQTPTSPLDPSMQQAEAAGQAPAPAAPNAPPTPTQQADKAQLPFRDPNAGASNQQPAGLPPPRMVGARTVQTVDPSVYQREMQGTEEEKAGRLAENQAQADAATKQAETLGNMAGQEYINQFQEESKARKLRSAYEDHAASMEQDRLEMAKAQPDYNRVFRGRPVLGALAAVAQGLGAAGAALTHTPNTAAQILADFVDRDVAQQKAAYEQKKESMQAKNSIFAEKMKAMGDPNAAEEAAKAHGLQAISLLAQREAAKSGSAEFKARATTIAGLLDQGSAQHQAAMEQRLQAGIVGGVGSSVNSDLYVPRAGGVATSKEQRDKLVNDGSAYGTLQTLGQKALALRQQLTAPNVALHPVQTYEIHRELQALQSEMQHAVQETSGFKRLSDRDAKINIEQIGNVTGWAPGTSERLKSFLGDKQREEQQMYEAEGIHKAQSGYRYDARGQIVPGVALTGQDYRPPPTVSPAGQVR
jgi:hypothetical protein